MKNLTNKNGFVLIMIKATNIAIIALITFFMPALAAQGQQSNEKTKNTGEVIGYLIEKVKSSQLTFIRNGKRHSSVEAAQHVRKKYEYFKSRIESPEDFIRICASKSLVSGKPYMVVTPQGKVTAESWLGQILAEYRGTQATLEHGLP